MAATSTGRCNTCGFAVGATLPTTLQTLFTHNFGDIRGKSVTEVIEALYGKDITRERFLLFSHTDLLCLDKYLMLFLDKSLNTEDKY